MTCENTPDNTIWIRTGCIFTYDGNVPDSLLNYSVLLLNLTYYCCYYYHTTRTTTLLVSSGNDRRTCGGDGGDTRGALNGGGSTSVLLLCLLLGGVTVFQWILCLMVGCSGISIIWCALCGWIVRGLYSDTRKTPTNGDNRSQHDLNPPEQEQDSGRIINDHDNNNDSSSHERFIINSEEETNLVTLIGSHHSQRGVWLVVLVGVVLCVDMVTIVYYGIVAERITTVAHICAIILGASLHVCFSSRRKSITSTPTTTDSTR